MAQQALIKVDASKCNNCHSCISVCPVKTCLNGSGDKISIIDERCIGCGRCIPACRNGARSIDDDTADFFLDLKSKVPITVIMAPAVFAVFEDVFRLNGFLYSNGVGAIFDVAFGAELTVKSYLEYTKTEHPKIIIAQPCAAIVNYCEIYQPELLPHLAPLQSPMLHTAIMIRNFFPEYADTKLAAISPCGAKKREFQETGLISYNVTMLGLQEYITRNGIKLDSYEPYDFIGPVAERAVSFSSPGGLRETILRDAPELETGIRKIEGTEIVYKYLKELPQMLKDNTAPRLVDCLSCMQGCNGGPGTGNYDKPVDKIEYNIQKRTEEKIKNHRSFFKTKRFKGETNKYWHSDIYNRTYENLSSRLDSYKLPSRNDINEIFVRMKKISEADFLNCTACGYGSCYGMAEAIFNGLNRPENCHQFLKNDAQESLFEHKILMENVRDAVFLIGKNKKILPSYSKETENVFSASNLAGKNFSDVLCSVSSGIKRDVFEDYLDKAFDPSFSEDNLKTENPLESIEAKNGKKLHFVFSRINSKDSIEKLLIIVHDIKSNAAKDETKQVCKKPEQHKKNVNAEIGSIEKYIHDPLKQKMMHNVFELLQNFSIDNSIEEPALRKKCGKNETGKVILDLQQEGGDLYVSYCDDGNGINASESEIPLVNKKLESVKKILKDLNAKNIKVSSKKGSYFQLDWKMSL
ncbi:MAG: 4Fe-4S binding protein [Spirochaetaceae bacterium]|jgi:iron only hydrogenase large subunit-like protein|nr:4Fe-4S binding protein [Spirochaetaceae bacterium]